MVDSILASQTPPLFEIGQRRESELTFLSQPMNLAAGVGMKIRPRQTVNIVILFYSTSVLKTEIANEPMIHDFTKNLCLL